MEIRDFDPQRDRKALRARFIELQEFERSLDPRMPAGVDVADAYLEVMFRRCRDFDGSVLVAEAGGALVGFATIWTRYRSCEPDDDPTEHGFLSDLVVSASYRGAGAGRALLRAAEARARAAGAGALRLSVKAGNAVALSLYADEGFSEYEHQLEKRLS